MKQQSFGRFQGEKGAKKKERIRQEKKAVRQETREYFEKKKAEEKAKRSGTYPAKTVKTKNTSTQSPESITAPVIKAKPGGEMPLNKFIAHAGICSRRDAAELVKTGKVTVN